MRNLASQLEVTPMAIYHHFANREALMGELSDLVYAQVVKDFKSASGEIRDKIKKLLILYYKTGLQHPNLILTIFSTPEAFSTEVRQITNCLAALLETTKLPEDRQQMWLEILVDFTHGSSIATAMVSKTNPSFAKEQTAKYARQLDELLDQIF